MFTDNQLLELATRNNTTVERLQELKAVSNVTGLPEREITLRNVMLANEFEKGIRDKNMPMINALKSIGY